MSNMRNETRGQGTTGEDAAEQDNGPPSLLLPPILGVFAALFDARGAILLLHRSDLDMWCLPGGLVEHGESLADAVVRECREETGAEIAVRGMVGAYSDPTRHVFRFRSGVTKHFVTLVFLAEIVEGTPRSCSHESRGIGYFLANELPRVVPSHQVWIEDSLARVSVPFIR